MDLLDVAKDLDSKLEKHWAAIELTIDHVVNHKIDQNGEKDLSGIALEGTVNIVAAVIARGVRTSFELIKTELDARDIEYSDELYGYFLNLVQYRSNPQRSAAKFLDRFRRRPNSQVFLLQKISPVYITEIDRVKADIEAYVLNKKSKGKNEPVEQTSPQAALSKELLSSLDQIFDAFQHGEPWERIVTQISRWRGDTRRKIVQSFDTIEGDSFNSIPVKFDFSNDRETGADAFLDYIRQSADYLSSLKDWSMSTSLSEKQKENPDSSAPDKTRVFVVHGRNEPINRALYAFLRSLQLVPLEWNTLVAEIGGTPYIGEVVVAGIKRAQAVLVLCTPDEEVRLRSDHANGKNDPDLATQFQPRPNVIFEAGMALALCSERTIVVQVGCQRIFSDLFGRHAVQLDGTSETRNDIANRLRSAGCKVNTSGKHWLSEGNFDLQTPTAETAAKPTTQEPAASENLNDLQIEIIRLLATQPKIGQKEIASRLGKSEIKIEHNLTELSKSGHVGAHLNIGSPARYVLLEAGTRFAAEKLDM